MIKCGLLGLPNVGKSTIFNALTNSQIPAANYPFCTIEPNKAIVAVPDERIYKISSISSSAETIPTSMEFIDIAGLVRGASKGEGLGNKFLEHIRSTDVLGHVIRCFQDKHVTHVNGSFNPKEDIDIITTELILADIAMFEKIIRAFKRPQCSQEKTLQDTYIKALEFLNQGNELFLLQDREKIDFKLLNKLNLLTTKPLFFIANVDSYDTKDNFYLEEVFIEAKKRRAPVVVIQALAEYEISKLEQMDKQAILELLAVQDTALSKLINVSYKTLDLVTYFTTSEKSTRAWTIPKHTKATTAAACIHSDFKKHFIRAKVVKFDDFITYKGLAGATAAGKLRTEGKEYVVADGDIIHWLVSC